MPSAHSVPSFLRLLAVAVPVIAALALLPRFAGIYQIELITYGLAFAIAALGFNLLLATPDCSRSVTPPISARAPTPWHSSRATCTSTPWSCASWGRWPAPC